MTYPRANAALSGTDQKTPQNQIITDGKDADFGIFFNFSRQDIVWAS